MNGFKVCKRYLNIYTYPLYLGYILSREAKILQGKIAIPNYLKNFETKARNIWCGGLARPSHRSSPMWVL